MLLAAITVLFYLYYEFRYATRVLYMLDGSIVHDEATRLGEVPERAREVPTEEDETLAGISAFMQEIPAKPAPARKHITKDSKKAVKPKKTTKKKAAKK